MPWLSHDALPPPQSHRLFGSSCLLPWPWPLVWAPPLHLHRHLQILRRSPLLVLVLQEPWPWPWQVLAIQAHLRRCPRCFLNFGRLRLLVDWLDVGQCCPFPLFLCLAHLQCLLLRFLLRLRLLHLPDLYLHPCPSCRCFAELRFH